MTFIQTLMNSKKHIDEVDLDISVADNVAVRPRLERMRFLEAGVEANLYRMLYSHGPGNGTALFMPFDQKSSEHGPGHEFLWERDDATAEEINLKGKGSADIRAIAELVNSGNFSGYVLHPGNIRQSKHLFRPDIPLIYKIDGHITQPLSAGIMSTAGTIEDALKYGASAIGLTIYPGGEHIKADLERAAEIIREAHKVGLVAVVWAYARGPGLDEKIQLKDKNGEFQGMTQADSLYWTHYAVSIASGLLGADLIKTKYPLKIKPDNRRAYDAYIDSLAKKNSSMIAYKYLEPKDAETALTMEQESLRASLVVQAAPYSIVIFSGGPKLPGNPTETLKKQTEILMKAGAEGAIYGRNIWGLPVKEGLETARAVNDVISMPEFHRKLTEPRFTGY
ncbi:putative Fructose-bisphosphate aldolase [Candidatus Methanoperedens nitroreducens]|uniref:fructose-bisphosphate aldolase n=2 Tax=Candidatus Methanoperedens nitratireducens TaxID=1392998 RepID=A0A284VLE0_9EURY|nr:putative Fructose-bisphosphate aldolase [Candidatus Methanoperedens nitroreducens]